MNDGARILHVDDDPTILRVSSRILESAGYRVTGIEDPTKTTLDFTAFDLLLLDWMLPGTSGLAIAAAARAEGYTGPIILMSSKNLDRDERAQLEEVEARWLSKPFGPHHLLHLMRAALSGETPE